MGTKYILIGQSPVLCEDLMEWCDWFENSDRQVARTKLFGICFVSTIFLGTDHSYNGRYMRAQVLELAGQLGLIEDCPAPPILFESMTFWAGTEAEEQDRCSTWSQAEMMHAHMVAEVSRPAAVLAYMRRRWDKFVDDAKEDWGKRWQELMGRDLAPTCELEQSMELMNARLEQKQDTDWMEYG